MKRNTTDSLFVYIVTVVMLVTLVVAVFAGMSAFVNFAISLFTDFPVTWENVGKVMVAWMALNLVFVGWKSTKNS